MANACGKKPILQEGVLTLTLARVEGRHQFESSSGWVYLALHSFDLLTVLQAMHAAEAPNLIPTDAPQLRELEAINSWVYNDIANGAYKAGFASKQQAYETAYRAFFVALDRLELLLSKRKYAAQLLMLIHLHGMAWQN